MATGRLDRQDTSRQRHRSLDERRDPSATYTDLTSKAGTKRLFSTRDSKVLSGSTNHGESDEVEAVEEEVHSEKRHRASDWPLSNTSPTTAAPARAPLRSRNTPNSPPLRKSSRPSKFVEGSMNDRTSQKPPIPYLGTDEETLERYESDNRGRKMAQPRKLTHNRDSSTAVYSDTSRHSSIFRFGKSIAASFNPSNWKIWSKQNNQQDEETAQQRILRERQEKAEQKYKELKQSGHFRGKVGSAAQLVQAADAIEGINIPPNKHDSGIGLDETVASGAGKSSASVTREEKRKGRVFLEPPKLPSDHRDQSPGLDSNSRYSTPRRQSFNLARASLSNIKKALNYESETTSSSSQGLKQARRIPSRKDLQKQQKLVKRVSDLEGKLEVARRQLAEAHGEPIPSIPSVKIGRSKFVGGALSTLPSERLLAGYVSAESDLGENEQSTDIGRAVTSSHPDGNVALMSGARADDLRETSSNKAAVGGLIEKPLPSAPPTDHDEIIQSVEVDDLASRCLQKDKNVAEQGDTRLSTTKSSDAPSADDSSYEGNVEVSGSDQESTARPESKKLSTKSQPSRRKRKSNTFERLADDGGRYKPSTDSQSDDDSDLELATTKKKLGTSRPPRKLQKVAQEPIKSTVLPKQRASTNKNGPKVAAAAAPPARTGSQRTAAPTKLVKNKVTRSRRQSVSPPPSPSFTGLDQAMPPPSSASSKTKDVAYIADPSNGHGVPPMPKMPRSVRLASGELVNTASTATAKSQLSAKNENSELSRSEPSFVWPEDVF